MDQSDQQSSDGAGPFLSIFIMSMGRPDQLKDLLGSLVSGASSLYNIEIFLGLEHDDEKTIQLAQQFASTYNNPSHNVIRTCIFEGEGVEECVVCESPLRNRHKELLDPMVKMSGGKYLWVLNDDVIVMTSHYDEIIRSDIEHHLKGQTQRENNTLHNTYKEPTGNLMTTSDIKDRILYCRTNELYSKRDRKKAAEYNERLHKLEWVASYPLVTRELVEAMGCMLPIEIVSDGADIALSKIIRSLLVSRSLEIPKVSIIDRVYGERDEFENLTEESETDRSDDHRCRTDGWLLDADREAAYIEKIHSYIKEHADEDEENAVLIDVPVPYDCRFCLVFKCNRCSQNIDLPVDMIRYSMEHLQCGSCKHQMLISRMRPTQGFLWYVNVYSQAVRACYPMLAVEIFVPLLQRMLGFSGIGKMFAQFVADNADDIEAGLGAMDDVEKMKMEALINQVREDSTEPEREGEVAE